MGNSLLMHHAQQLVMSRQLQQAIRILQLSSQELEQEIDGALNTNVFLEREEPNFTEEKFSDGETPTHGGSTEQSTEAEPAAELTGTGYLDYSNQDNDEDDTDPSSYTACHTGLREHLLWQVGASALTPRDRALATMIVDALDEDGYLRQGLDDLNALLSVSAEPDHAEDALGLEDLNVALRFVQSLDPIGVGARSVSECLELQLRALPDTVPEKALALAIVREHLPLLASHDSVRLTRVLGCDDAALRAANCLILKLNPRPGSAYSKGSMGYVVADVIVRRGEGRWIATINPEVLPRLKVNHMYAQLAQAHRSASSSTFNAQFQEARWLIRNVQQRFQTIQRVAQVIVDRQRAFFEHGDLAMKPLILGDVAKVLGLHESTVSRASSNKFMATERGVIEFKHFFGSQVVSEEGHVWSSTAVRALIRELISAEDATAPLSDIKLARMLGARGVGVARRTVAKYRDAMRIPPVAARRMSVAA